MRLLYLLFSIQTTDLLVANTSMSIELDIVYLLEEKYIIQITYILKRSAT